MITAVAYYRMSTDEQTESIPGQRAAVERWAREHGYKITAEYIDEGVSGDDTERRADFLRMRTDAAAGKFKAILCWDQDRFGRFDSLEAGYWIHPLRKAGIKLVSVTEGGPINWDDFTGRVMYSLKQEGKHQYLRDLSRNVMRGMLERARLGLWVGGPPPLGYVVGADERLHLGRPHDIATVRTIFDGYLAGHSLRSLVEVLNAKDCRTGRGNPFEYVGVRFILRNRAYTGDLIWNLRSMSKYGSIRRGLPTVSPLDGLFHDQADWFLSRDAHPAIVSREEYEAVQERLLTQRQRSTPKPNGGKFVLSGLLRCGQCGEAMTGATYGGLLYYVCCGYYHRGAAFCSRNAVRQDELTGKIIETIERDCLSPAAVKKLRASVSRQANSRAARLERDGLESRLATTQRELEAAERNMALASTEFLRLRYERVVTDLAEQEQALIAGLEAATARYGGGAGSVDERIRLALKRLKSLRTTLEAADTVRLREFLHLSIERVKVFVHREQREKRGRFFLAGGEIEMKPLNLLAEHRCSQQVKRVIRWGNVG